MDCAFLQNCCQGYEESVARIDRLYSELSHNQLTWIQHTIGLFLSASLKQKAI